MTEVRLLARMDTRPLPSIKYLSASGKGHTVNDVPRVPAWCARRKNMKHFTRILRLNSLDHHLLILRLPHETSLTLADSDFLPFGTGGETLSLAVSAGQ